jgi:hypothetical protein
MTSATTRVLAAATATALTFGFWAAASGTAHARIDAGDRASASRDAGIAHKASGYGTKVRGGQVPVASDTTAFMVIGCATRTGVEKGNHEAEAELPGAGTVSGVRTKLWTVRSGAAVHTYSRNTTANVVLAQSGLGTIEITAIRSLSHAWHDAQGFHADTSVSVGNLLFTPPVGEPQELDLPTPGQPIEIPGLAKISVGAKKESATDQAGIAIADALRVHLIPTNTKLTVAHSNARVYGGVKHGTFRGSSAATRVSAADDTITSGRTPLSLMPCQGTDGEQWTKQIAVLDAGGEIIVEGLRSSQRGKQLSDRSVAMERGSITSLNFGDGALVIDAVAAQANVTRTAGGKVTSNTQGTTIGSITADGEAQEFPDTGVIEIPGLAKIERKIVERTRFGISVIALRITLLDGTAAVIDLGVARTSIR